jgi:hypothetical protein
MIKKGDIVLHTLSGLFYICENKQHEKWMNENTFYRLATSDEVAALPEGYFKKEL